MDRLRKALPAIAISSLFIIVFNALSFLLAKEYTKNFWCGYVFITLSWLCLIGSEVIATSKTDGGKALFLNAPGLLITVAHLVIQTLLGVLVMVIPVFSIKAALCFEIIIFAIYLGLYGSLEIYKSKSK